MEYTKQQYVAGALAFATLGGFAVPSRAAEIHAVIAGDTANNELSLAVLIGDVDEDGYDDIALGDPFDDTAGTDAGRIVVISGADFTTEIWSVDGVGADDLFGWDIAWVPDCDQDGIPDVIIGAPGDGTGTFDGYAEVRSGDDGTLIKHIAGFEDGSQFGYAVAGFPDMNSDSRGDVLVASPGEDAGGTDAGRVRAISAYNGTVIHTATGDAAGDRMGESLQGDQPVIAADMDTGPIIGAPKHATGNVVGLAETRGRSNFQPDITVTGEDSEDRLGVVVDFVGDVDDDDRTDWIIGSDPKDSSGDPSGPSYVQVVSGDDGTIIYDIEVSQVDSGLSIAVAGIGDVDGDGVPDFAIGMPWDDGNGTNAGAVQFHSGSDGSLITIVEGPGAGARFGMHLSAGGDIDGDTLDDVLVGAPGADEGGTDAGAIYVITFSAWDTVSNGIAGLNGIPEMAGRGTFEADTVVLLDLEDARENADVVLTMGYILVIDPTHGVLVPSPDIVVDELTTDANGELTYSLTLPEELEAGDVLYFQYRITDAAAADGEALSNTISGTVPE